MQLDRKFIEEKKSPDSAPKLVSKNWQMLWFVYASILDGIEVYFQFIQMA
jgi:hypothetical protein